MVFKKILLQNEEPEFHGIIWAKPEKDSIDLKIWRETSWWTVAASSFTPEQISQIIDAVSEQISPEDLGTLSRDQIYNLLNSKANTSDIPTSLSDLNDDATHRTVTDTEKQVWNNKQESISDLNTIRQNASNAYQKPNTGIPLSDLSEEVQNVIENAGSLTEETDPIFVASAAHGITSSDISNWNSKQNALTFDSTPTAGSNNPVTSAGIKAYVDNATPTITMDNTPTSGSNNAVKSSGIYNALQGKQNTLTFDSTPTASSSNPVTSGGVKTALDLKANQSTTYTKTEVDGLFDDVAYLADDDGQATTLTFDPQADTVWNKAQTLSSAQKQQARENIGAAGINDIAGMQVVNHGTSDTTFALTPNKFHVWGEVASLTLTFATGEVGYIQEYIFQFTSGSTATTLNLPSSVKWITSNTVEANKTYQVSILNSLAVMGGA